MKTTIIIITCFFLTFSFATDSYAGKGFNFKCKICKEISEFIETKLRGSFEFIQDKTLNALYWIDEKFNLGLLTKTSGRLLGKVCKEYEMCCSEPLDNFCKDLSEVRNSEEFCKQIGDKIDIEKIKSCQKNFEEEFESFFDNFTPIDKSLFDN